MEVWKKAPDLIPLGDGAFDDLATFLGGLNQFIGP